MGSEETVRANETTIPTLPCAEVEATLDFYQALGFEVFAQQRKPYLYIAMRWSGFELHLISPPKGMDPELENGGVCLVMVDAVAPYHATFKDALRTAYGKVPAKGRPRITRYKPGASRFTLIDPSGNSVIFIQRDEPAELEYGGSEQLHGLAKALDNARIFRDFKNDDRAAYRALNSAHRRHNDQGTSFDRARAYANLIDLAIILDEPGRLEEWTAALRTIELTSQEQQAVSSELTHTTVDEILAGEVGPTADPAAEDGSYAGS